MAEEGSEGDSGVEYMDGVEYRWADSPMDPHADRLV